MSKRKPASVVGNLFEAETPNSADTDANAHLWRQLGQAKRDLVEFNHDRQREIALWLRLHNGFAKRFEEIVTDFTAGEDPHPKADDEKVQAVLDEFWDDPVNNMRSFARELAGQLGVIGEQFVPAFVQQSTGRLRLGYLDPDYVSEVVPMPGNPRDLVEVIEKASPGKLARVFKLVRPHEKVEDVFDRVIGLRLPKRPPEMNDREGARYDSKRKTYSGIAFAFAVNKLSNATRGISDLFSTADYLDGMDKTVFNAVERSFILNTLAVDVKTGGDEKEMKTQERNVRKAFSKPGGIFVHNDSVEANTHSADLSSADMAELVKIVKLVILGSWGFPLHWFADGGEANLATAGEMGGPTIRKLQSRQTVIRQMLRTFCDFQLQLVKALAPERLSGVDDDALKAFEIVLPEIVGKDTAREANALYQTTNVISVAESSEYLTTASAARMWQNMAGSVLGFEFSDADRALIQSHADAAAAAAADAEDGELAGDSEDDAAFNELTLAIQRLASIGDEALIDALRNELFARLGMQKPDVLDREVIVNPEGAPEEPEPSSPPPFIKPEEPPVVDIEDEDEGAA